MAFLDTIRETFELRRARGLADDHAFDEALQQLLEHESAAAEDLREVIRDEAVHYWAAAAERTWARGEAKKTRARLDRARRYAGKGGHPVLDALERRLRRQSLRETRPEHFSPLLDTTLSAPPDPSWQALVGSGLLKAVAQLWALDVDLHSVAHADRHALHKVRSVLTDRYPAGLVPRGGFDECFVRGVLYLALGRPDHAVMPLLEADDREPLVAFELARVAQALGHPEVAVLALEGFAARAGGHHRIDRLHTGVFLAQMCLVTGRTLQALDLYDQLPIALLGGRPSLMFARLLLDHGREDEARRLLESVWERQPDLDGLQPLLDEAGLAGPLG